MNPSHQPQGYLLLFRGTNWHRQLSPDEIERIMSNWTQWFEDLQNEGKITAASPLENTGTIITSSESWTDQAFTESREAIGGFFLLNVPTFDEAIAIARLCPALPHGITVEVRPVAPACPAARMIDESRALQSAQ